ncbi:MAG TPA: permease [Gaiellaceae bacterium]|nr:permease [Gaiellaceae bacterium]
MARTRGRAALTHLLHELWRALSFAFGMTWEILWALVLGFALSAAVQAVVSKREMGRLLPDSSPRTLAVASGLGAASSSCSYASVARARSLFRKGADFTAAMAFEIASTNLVIELGIVMALLLGWQFVVGEFVGGPLMIVFVAVLFRAFLRPRLVEEARAEAEKGRLGSMEGHAEMDMSIGPGKRLRSPAGFTATADYFVMDWAAVGRDIAGGLLIAGALAAWVPNSFWRGLFLEHHGTLGKVWGPLIGPAVAMLSFVCSIGNVPLAAVLWNGGISFGGVIAFVFADLLILPILDIYRRYYGWRMAAFIFGTFYVAMAAAGLVVEFLFQGLGIERTARNAKVMTASVSWNYTTYLNVVFLLLAAALVWRYFRRGGGMAMLKMMNTPMDEHAHHHHHHEHAHDHG